MSSITLVVTRKCGFTLSPLALTDFLINQIETFFDKDTFFEKKFLYGWIYLGNNTLVEASDSRYSNISLNVRLFGGA